MKPANVLWDKITGDSSAFYSEYVLEHRLRELKEQAPDKVAFEGGLVVLDTFALGVSIYGLCNLAPSLRGAITFLEKIGSGSGGAAVITGGGIVIDGIAISSGAVVGGGIIWNGVNFVNDLNDLKGAIDDAKKEINNFGSEKLLQDHYEKHASEFGDISIDEYLQQANDLLNSDSADILTKVRENGDVIYYNEATNEFAVKTAEGIIRTYFRPIEGIDYFLIQ